MEEDVIDTEWGYATRKRKMTPLEIELGVEIRPIDDAPEGVKVFDGSFVDVTIGTTRYLGMISGITKDGRFILKPTTFNDVVGQNPKSSPVERNVWLNECKIAYGHLDSIERMTASLGQTGARGFEKVSNLGKYIGDLKINPPEDYSI